MALNCTRIFLQKDSNPTLQLLQEIKRDVPVKVGLR